MPDLLHRRLREEPLPVPHAPTASGWSNSSRVGFFLLLDQDALSRRTAPPIYSVSLLTRLRCALGGNGILRPTAVRSFLARICQTQNPTKTMKKSEITRQGLDNVGFIGFENNLIKSARNHNDSRMTTVGASVHGAKFHVGIARAEGAERGGRASDYLPGSLSGFLIRRS
jgi:hypothetical protein